MFTIPYLYLVYVQPARHHDAILADADLRVDHLECGGLDSPVENALAARGINLITPDAFFAAEQTEADPIISRSRSEEVCNQVYTSQSNTIRNEKSRTFQSESDNDGRAHFFGAKSASVDIVSIEI